MAFNVSTLNEFVNELQLPLLKKAVLSTPTQGVINVMTGVKHSTAMNIIASTPVIQDGSNCTWNPTGSTTFSNRILTVSPLKVEMSYCPADLQKKWMNYQVRTSAMENPIPFEADVLNSVMEQIAVSNEKAIWQSTTGATTLFTGLLAHIVADATPVVVTGLTTCTAVVNTMYLEIPVEILDKAEILVGMDFFRKYVQELTAANMYHYNPTDDANGFYVPGTNTKIRPLSGLNSQNKVIACDPKNLYYGVDFTGDAESVKMFYSEDNDQWRLRVKYSLGTQIAFPDQVKYCTYTA